MFTIEHGFDATTITLVDEGKAPLGDDVVIHAFDDTVTVEQFDLESEKLNKISISLTQLDDLVAALDLPEGSYRRDLTRSKP